MFKDKKIVIAIVVILALLLISIIYIKVQDSRTPRGKAAETKMGKIISTVTAIGIVEASSASLGSDTSGRVSWIGIKDGNKVKSGDILIKLEGYDKAERDLQRTRRLYKSGFASKADLEKAELMADSLSIKSPINGIVSKVDAKVGESVIPGSEIVSIVNPSDMWIEIQIDEIDIAEVSVGQKVEIYTDAYPDESFLGRITWKSPEAELKRVAGRIKVDEEDMVFRAKVILLSGQKVLKPGMSIHGEIITHLKEDVLVVPREAIFTSDGKSYVFAVEKGRAKKKVVALGLRDPDNVEVEKGLKVGEIVAVSNLEKLKDGGRVKIE